MTGKQRIRRLPPETTGKIAAGEVIERPVNAVKELLENALDASASRVSISVDEGGRRAIRVEDDGTGIPSAELPLAAESYATSKIGLISDLGRITTLGFRGEALASIRAVARLTIRSRDTSEEVGREMRWDGGIQLRDEPAVMKPGTEVIVEELFHNLPAREKFLSSDAAEVRRITALVQSYALAWPDVSLVLSHNGREILSYPACSFAERAEMVFGSSVFPGMRAFEGEEGGMRVHGYTTIPSVTRGNRSMQFLFVNGRPVKDRLLAHAVRQAYQSLVPADRFPMTVLLLEIAPSSIDVNVHPTKAEVRFASEREVHRLVSAVVREAVRGTTVSFRDKVESVYRAIYPDRPQGRDRARETDAQQPLTGFEEGIPGRGGEWLFREAPEPLLGTGGEDAAPAGTGLYWQLHDSYIMIQIRGGMVVIDQHAAHERVLFDTARAAVEKETPVMQSLLFPSTIELSVDEYACFEAVAPMMPRLGFEVEPFGARAVIVRAIPAGVRNWNDGALLREILGDLGGPSPAVDEVLRSFACRSAVKAGEPLSAAEMEALTDQLFATEFPFTCPHGRPTMLRVDLRELERRFHRTQGSGR